MFCRLAPAIGESLFKPALHVWAKKSVTLTLKPLPHVHAGAMDGMVVFARVNVD
jgi:hypothetical protein